MESLFLNFQKQEKREKEKMKVVAALFLMVVFFLAYTQMIKGIPQPGEDCQTECDNVKIEYPFGISAGCYYPGEDSFNLSCVGDKLYTGDLQVRNFYNSSQLQVLLKVSSTCYDSTGNEIMDDPINYQLDEFSVSGKNKFMVVGCNAVAFLYGLEKNYSDGCASFCQSPPAENGECNGVGCASTDVSYPVGADTLLFLSARIGHMVYVHQFNPCTYVFLVKDASARVLGDNHPGGETESEQHS